VTAAAELRGASKRFGAAAALAGVDLAVEEGEVLALLGPNGAGKSTALALLLGLRVPDTGTARLYGCDPRRAASRRRVGVALQEAAFPPTLRVAEVVELVRRHYPRPAAAAETLERFGLAALAGRQLGGLSGGERRRVAVAAAFAGGAGLVVVDEPTSGLDGASRRAVWDAVREHVRAGGTTLLTTHDLAEAEALAGRVVLLDRGTVAASGTVAAITAAAGLTRVAFRAAPGLDLDGAEREGDRLCLAVADAGACVERLVRRGVRLVDLEVRPLSLEEAIAVRRAAA
jgi:ABC-2 type transport system ATP-binding protein